jgi:uncharacterized protein
MVPVAQLLGRPGEYRDLEVSGPLGGVGNALVHLTSGDIWATLRLESVVEGVLVTGSVAAETEIECSRCLQASPSQVETSVTELYASPRHMAETGEDAYRLEGPELDLEPMVRDAVGLALPLNPLCRDDCRGLCVRCGKDLNTGPCECRDDQFDPRWSALADLREKLATDS